MPARAEDGFCASLRRVWTAVKGGDVATVRQGLGGGWACHLQEKQDVICLMVLPDPAAARDTYASLRASAASCMAPSGLKPSTLPSMKGENTMLDGSGTDPGVVMALVAQRSVTLMVISNGP